MCRFVLANVVLLITGVGCFDPAGLINGFLFSGDDFSACAPFAEDLTPLDYGLEFESFSVQSENGNTVRGWFIPASTESPPIGTVMISNGSRGTRSCVLPQIAVLADAGFNAVTYDYQGFGDSDGFKSIDLIAADALAVFEWTIASDDASRQRVALFGVSLGTGPSLLLARKYPDQVWATVLDSAYAIPPEFVFPSLAGLLDLLVPYAIGAFPTSLDNTLNMPHVSAPLLMLHGTMDPLTGIEGAEQLFSSAPNALKFVTFEGLGHVQAVFRDPKRYEEEVISFLLEQVQSCCQSSVIKWSVVSED